MHKAGILRRQHRHRHEHPSEDPRRHVRHARFPEVIPVANWTTRRHSRDDPREDVRVGIVECQLNHASSRLYNSATLTFDILTSGSMHAERLPCTTCHADFGGDRSSRFSFRARTQDNTHAHKVTQTQLIMLPTPRLRLLQTVSACEWWRRFILTFSDTWEGWHRSSKEGHGWQLGTAP